jgi:rod shape determining protein RodA
MGPGGFQVQPSEFAKLVAALLVAKLFAEAKKETLGLFDLLVPGAAVGLMVVLIAAEPDLGTAFTLVPLFLTVAFLAGLRVRAILGVVLVMMVVGSLGWMFALKEYQKSRIYTFLDPNLDPRGAATRRSSPRSPWARAGWRARATSRAPRASSGTCPPATPTSSSPCSRRRTGSWAWWRCSDSTCSSCGAPSRPRRWLATAWAAFLAAGIAAILSFQVIYNVAMVAGLVPVKGLPLPLMSYGGSSVLSSLFAVGLILNVRMRRFAN